ncbi:MAG TPA: GAF domain-containing SpoIIE family protein phosphatase [Gemmatimonadaceae bacterium]|nr:GAF domain-containing SpoIIE family protein phosphatase [Gemmatimonadaceae bacterium]
MSTADDLRAAQREAELAAEELAERYEEINLLYAIGEIIGRTVSLEDAASIILKEIAETVGARRGVIAVHDAGRGALRPVATRGLSGQASDIRVDDAGRALARAFRDRRAVSLAPDAPRATGDDQLTGALLAVPILWTSPSGATALGAVALSDRTGRGPFTAGDQKLLSAIATQIGTAIENARLVRASLDQQRLAQEMQLAHDLQMKLLPDAAIVEPHAEAAARVLPATSVGGDFYHLFPLAGERTGVMIGDVSGHGYQAALIMALAMSASAIHAQRTADPARVVHAMLDSLRGELRDTDMYLTLCYTVIDPSKGQLRYANLGHPHAFVVRANGTTERLLAHEPPLGLDMVAKVDATTVPWKAGKDLLVLFTDGVSDARDRDDKKLGERRVLDEIIARRADDAADIVEHVIGIVKQHEGNVERRDDLTLVVVRA